MSEKGKHKDYAGAKQMKDETRITLMVRTAANGIKVLLAMVGKPKQPKCFTLYENNTPPMAYCNQKNAWFDQAVTWWWINNVFLPPLNKMFGHARALLILDNCSAHNIDLGKLPPHVKIMFLPPNMTSKHQPADMGMIASLNFGYKVIMLGKLLDIFDIEGGYEAATLARKSAK